MIASLMMYTRPELEPALDRYWDAIRAALAARGIASPMALSQTTEEFAVWTDPELVLSQTCGMPYRTQLHKKVTLIGTPDYGLPGCAPGHYYSAIISRANDPRTEVVGFESARFAYNMAISQSGFAAPYAHCTALGFWFRDRVQSHSHVQSARMVAEGKADIAALDAVTWDLIKTFEPWAKNLRVLETTAPTPGLPYIAGPHAHRQATFDALSEAMDQLTPADRAQLGLKGLIDIPKEAYLAIPNPPANAA